jgi:predicted RNA binding protein YcfA (HicA-like mRNA interferase family)
VTLLPFDKRKLDKWRSAVEEKDEEVFSFLSGAGFKLVNNRGSHYTYAHHVLGKYADLFPQNLSESLRSGRLIVIFHNGRVMKYVLKRIVEACERIEEYEELEAKRGGLRHDKKH